MSSENAKVSTVSHRLIRSGAFLLFAFALVIIFLLHQPQDNKEIGEGKATQTAEKVEYKKSFGQRFSSDPINFLTTGLLIVGIAQAGLFFWQLSLIRTSLADTKKAAKAAKRQARLARDSLIASQRAWIKVGLPDIRYPLTSYAPGLKINIDVPIQNIGTTPAIDIAITAWIDFINADENTHPHFKNIADAMRSAERHDSQIEFPEHRDGHFRNVFVSAICVWKVAEQYAVEMIEGVVFLPLLVGCVTYSFPTDSKGRHQTRFAYRIHTTPSVTRAVGVKYEAIRLEAFIGPHAFDAD